MRFIISALTLAVGGPAGASLLGHGAAGIAHAFARLTTALPDPATAAVMFAGLGLVAGARRVRSVAVTD